MQGMRELLRGSLGKSLATLTPLDRLSAAWPVACGSALAARGELLSFAEGRLVIRVADAMWLDEMRAMRLRLTGELSRIARVAVREIHFEGGGERPRTAAGQVASATRQPAKPVGVARQATARSPRSRRTATIAPRSEG